MTTLAKSAPDVPRTFRAHSWIIWLVCAFMFVQAASMAARGGLAPPNLGLKLGLLLLFLAIPVALLVWDHKRGVHVSEAGIRSVGANGSRFFPWDQITGFDVAAYGGGTIAVFVQLADGKRVGLADTMRWPYQRASVQVVRDQLDDYRRGVRS